MFASARRSGKTAKLDAIERSQATVTFGLDGTLIEANENFLRLMGYTLGEVRGRHHRLFVDPAEAADPAYEAFWATLRRGEFQTAEYRRLAKGGREVWIRASYNPVLDLTGRPFRIVKFALDVTAEKRAAIDAAGQITAINRSQQAVIHFAPDGTILDANPHFLAATGYRADEIVGRHHRMFVTEGEGRLAGLPRVLGPTRPGEYQAGEFKRRAKDGAEIWIQATYNPILDAAAHAQDRQVRHRHHRPKQHAADTAGKIEAALRSQAVIEFDMDGTILDANGHFLTAMGYTTTRSSAATTACSSPPTRPRAGPTPNSGSPCAPDATRRPCTSASARAGGRSGSRPPTPPCSTSTGAPKVIKFRHRRHPQHDCAGGGDRDGRADPDPGPGGLVGAAEDCTGLPSRSRPGWGIRAGRWTRSRSGWARPAPPPRGSTRPPSDERGGGGHHGHRRADQPPGAQRHHRGGARRCRRPGLRRGGGRR